MSQAKFAPVFGSVRGFLFLSTGPLRAHAPGPRSLNWGQWCVLVSGRARSPYGFPFPVVSWQFLHVTFPYGVKSGFTLSGAASAVAAVCTGALRATREFVGGVLPVPGGLELRVRQ